MLKQVKENSNMMIREMEETKFLEIKNNYQK